MTLGENKKIMLALIEEYSPTSELLTTDEDISTRLNLVYAPNYQYISQEKKILRTKTITINEDSDSVLEQTLPSNMYQFRRIVGLDADNKRISVDYEIIGNKIYLQQKAGKYIIEYFAYPLQILSDTPDSFMLEVDNDAQAMLAYLVANDILKVDPSADYTAFLAEYTRRLERLDTRRILPSIEVEEA